MSGVVLRSLLALLLGVALVLAVLIALCGELLQGRAPRRRTQTQIVRNPRLPVQSYSLSGPTTGDPS